MNPSTPGTPAARIGQLKWIILAVAIWGFGLALGAYLYGYDPEAGTVRFAPNPWRGLIVALCVSVFLGGWALLLKTRRQAAPPGK